MFLIELIYKADLAAIDAQMLRNAAAREEENQ